MLRMAWVALVLVTIPVVAVELLVRSPTVRLLPLRFRVPALTTRLPVAAPKAVVLPAVSVAVAPAAIVVPPP